MHRGNLDGVRERWKVKVVVILDGEKGARGTARDKHLAESDVHGVFCFTGNLTRLAFGRVLLSYNCCRVYRFERIILSTGPIEAEAQRSTAKRCACEIADQGTITSLEGAGCQVEVSRGTTVFSLVETKRYRNAATE